MKISICNCEILHLSRNRDQCVMQVGGVSLKQVEKFKHLRVVFASDGRQNEEMDNGIAKASAVKQALHDSIVMKRKLLSK